MLFDATEGPSQSYPGVPGALTTHDGARPVYRKSLEALVKHPGMNVQTKRALINLLPQGPTDFLYKGPDSK